MAAGMCSNKSACGEALIVPEVPPAPPGPSLLLTLSLNIIFDLKEMTKCYYTAVLHDRVASVYLM